MTPEERQAIIDEQTKNIEEFKEHCRQELPILREQEKNIDRSAIKTWEDSRKYWRLRETIMIFNDTIVEREYAYPSEYYRECMRLAVECMECSKTLSEEIQARWYEKYSYMVMDFAGEARCKVGTPYHPVDGYIAVGEEKKIWEEIIKLWGKFHDLKPSIEHKY